MKTWDVSNCCNDEIVFNENEVDSKTSFNFSNCDKLKVTIPGKVKSFML